MQARASTPVRASAMFLSNLPGYEFEGRRVHAISQVRRLWAIIEYVSQVRITFCA